jgi:hypothetical protein
MENTYGNLPISTWFLINESMLTQGIIFEWPKYLKKITKVTYFRQAINKTAMSNQYYGISIWKFAYFHMVFD